MYDVKGALLLVVDRYLSAERGRSRWFELRKRHCLELQERASLPDGASIRPIPSVDAGEVTAGVFTALTVRRTSPLVVRGLFRDAAATRLWSLDFFKQRYGDDVYPVLATQPAGPKRNDMQIFGAHPELVQHLELERILALWEEPGATDQRFEAINMFATGAGRAIGGNLHCAFAGNYFGNFVGRKEFLLIDPVCTKYLLPVPARPFYYADAYFDPADDELGGFTRRLPMLSVKLDPGDLLFLPPWWWHMVRNLDELTIGCAIRSSSVLGDCANNLLLTLLSSELKLLLYKLGFDVKHWLSGETRNFRDALRDRLNADLGAARKSRATPLAAPAAAG
jgi:hypothetical protein